MDSATISLWLNFLDPSERVWKKGPEASVGWKRKQDEGDKFLPRQIYADVDRGDVESRVEEEKEKRECVRGTVQAGPRPSIRHLDAVAELCGSSNVVIAKWNESLRSKGKDGARSSMYTCERIS